MPFSVPEQSNYIKETSVELEVASGRIYFIFSCLVLNWNKVTIPKICLMN